MADAMAEIRAADQYIAGYNIQMSRLVDGAGKTLGFPPGPALITHWGLRDELKAHYGEGADGLAKQRAIAVRDALTAEGIAADRIRLKAPQDVTGPGSDRDARRVDIAVGK